MLARAGIEAMQNMIILGVRGAHLGQKYSYLAYIPFVGHISAACSRMYLEI